ncbi:hypothetical protein PINS_up011217 [Pythium insidiosum]|nr:hypothetical protein PINS_up011217 [Pythium insidiosum]
MAVYKINRAIRCLDVHAVEQALLEQAARDDDQSGQRDDDNAPPGVFVCQATLLEWQKYVESEAQEMKSRFMTFHDGGIYIVELAGIHESIERHIECDIILQGGRWLANRGARYVATAPILHEPDGSFGPEPEVPGAALPAGVVDWDEYHTLKIEVAVTQRWRDVERKAEIWRTYAGVQYVLCVRVSPTLRVADYALGIIATNGQWEVPFSRQPIVGPQTLVRFDCRRLLGLEPGAALPQGFANGNDHVEIDLFRIVERRRHLRSLRVNQ